MDSALRRLRRHGTAARRLRLGIVIALLAAALSVLAMHTVAPETSEAMTGTATAGIATADSGHSMPAQAQPTPVMGGESLLHSCIGCEQGGHPQSLAGCLFLLLGIGFALLLPWLRSISPAPAADVREHCRADGSPHRQRLSLAELGVCRT